MKKLALALTAALGVASSAFAGYEMANGKDKNILPAEPCFMDHEFQIDLFGTYTYGVQRSPYGDGFGGGVALTYYFHRYFGVGIEGNGYEGEANGVFNAGGRLLARYPLELGGVCLAPYAFVGGGAQFDGLTSGIWLAGAGLEWRATQNFGLFTEGRYTWAGNQADSAQGRVGVRIVF